LAPFRPILGRLIPEWRLAGEPPGEASLVVLGEAVLRVLAAVTESAGCVLVLEDLHWADTETLEVMEYLADNVADQPILCLISLRDEERTLAFLERHAKAGDGRPFFLQCSFPDPHHPFTPPGRYWGMYDPADIEHTGSFIASNRPPHVIGKNFIYQARPDGLTIGLFSTSMLREEMFPGAEYDSSRYTYVAELGQDANVFTVREHIPFQDVRDAMGASEPVLRSMTDAPEAGGIESLALGQMMIADFLDLPFEFVRTAERGTGPALLALERGDINSYQFGGGAWGLLPAQRPGWLADEFLRPFYDMGAGRGFFPNDEIQELTDRAIAKIDAALEAKQEEIMQI
jgi:hypothetical protein